MDLKIFKLKMVTTFKLKRANVVMRNEEQNSILLIFFILGRVFDRKLMEYDLLQMYLVFNSRIIKI